MSSVEWEPSQAARSQAARCLLIACLLLVCSAPLAQAADEPPSKVTALASPLSMAPPADSLVIGFMGGFVSRDASHHAEVRLLASLREEYPSNVHFGMYENRSQREAYTMIFEHLDRNHDGQLSAEEKSQAHILLFGHSWGASAVVALARRLNHEGIPVALTVQVDSVAKPFHNDSVIPANVHQAVNFYQTRGWIHGRRKIVAADPAFTQILGNFRYDYSAEPATFHDYPWLARHLMKGHIEIESDPRVWSQVRTLLQSQLPPPANQNSGAQSLTASR